ncbi:MAG: sugar phosphate isomerase/epimerase family protein [Thermodesulfobacteriota bacterium]|nr:sugar phosphate isomerase/epimerase family protein [Thermodesulfobacteriota bacterium]
MKALFDPAILTAVQVCIPFRLLKEKYLPLVLEKRINPEIGIDGNVMDTHSRKAFSEMASLLRHEGLSITLHGPFYDLAPGAMDKKILEATRERLRQAFDLIPLFEPAAIVCHTGYDSKRYQDDKDLWLETAMATWAPLLGDLQGTKTTLMLENVYEETPVMLLRLIKGLNSNKVGFCFDAGHMNAFSETNLRGWLEHLGPFVKELHIHDNHGTRDDHLAIGAGNIDFDTLFRYVEKNRLKPIMTLEAHKEKWIWQSLEALSRSGPFCRIVTSL